MTGSYYHYYHCVDDEGRLRHPDDLNAMLENGGDVYEVIEELYGMVWYLAGGDELRVEEAQRMYRVGLQSSPGPAPEEE
jgi:hypothetical protein